MNSILADSEYSSKQDIIERLYLQSIIICYAQVEKTVAIENHIRDRFVRALKSNPLLKEWLEAKVIRLHWEKCLFDNEDDLGRIDLSFECPGMDFSIECKRLRYIDKNYFSEGLDRFIKLKYSPDEDFAGMLGFIIGGNQAKIHAGLKSISVTYNIAETDFARTPFTLWNDNFKETYIRDDNTNINVYHLFFDFSKK